MRGFRVAAGGGTATMCRSAAPLHEFLPVTDMFASAEAIVRVFHKLGDYKHKHKNRMKFLIKSLGWEGFRNEYENALAEVLAEGVPPLPFDPEAPPVEEAPDWVRAKAPSPESLAVRVQAQATSGPGIHPDRRPVLEVADADFLEWQRRNVRPQKHAGYVAATVTLPLGDITAEQLRVLTGLASAYGDGTLRLTIDQDLIVRWVPIGELERVLHAACRRRSRPGRSGPADQCHKLSGGRVVSACGDAVARARPHTARRARREQGAGGIRARASW